MRWNPLLTNSQKLWEIYKNNKTILIRNKLVEKYLFLVRKELRKIEAPQGIEKEDLYQYGILGLIKAIDNCDLQQIEKFEYYASFRVKGEIFDFLRKYGRDSQGASRSTLSKIKEMERIRIELERKKNCKVTNKDLMEHLKLKDDEFGKLQFKTTIYNEVNLDDYYDNSKYEKVENREDDLETIILKEELKNEVFSNIEKLKEKEAYVIQSYYLNNKNLHSIAIDLGVSAARVSQLHKNGLRTLRLLLTKETEVL